MSLNELNKQYQKQQNNIPKNGFRFKKFIQICNFLDAVCRFEEYLW